MASHTEVVPIRETLARALAFRVAARRLRDRMQRVREHSRRLRQESEDLRLRVSNAATAARDYLGLFARHQRPAPE